jgi:hypothetical protein
MIYVVLEFIQAFMLDQLMKYVVYSKSSQNFSINNMFL